MSPGIYVLRDRTNLKVYVGQSCVDVNRRSRHKNGPRDQYIDRAIRKRGFDNFERFVFFVPEELLNHVEREMIRRLDSRHPGGYNLESGGTLGKRHSPQTILKMSVSKRGEKNPRFGKPGTMLGRSSRLGKKLSEEAKRKISEAHRGLKLTEEHRSKISKALRGKISPLRGRSLSEEHKNKIRASILGRAA